MPIRLKRIQEPPAADDGHRVLVDRLWPRGISKERAHLDEWNKVVPPSHELRKAYHAGQMDFSAFAAAYRRELAAHSEELDRLRELAEGRTLTFLFASANTERHHVHVLMEVLGVQAPT